MTAAVPSTAWRRETDVELQLGELSGEEVHVVEGGRGGRPPLMVGSMGGNAAVVGERWMVTSLMTVGVALTGKAAVVGRRLPQQATLIRRSLVASLPARRRGRDRVEGVV